MRPGTTLLAPEGNARVGIDDASCRGTNVVNSHGHTFEQAHRSLCFFSQFVSKYISTIGIDYGVKPVTVNGESARINFWDLSGHPDFFEIRNEFYKDSQGVSE